MQARFKYDQFCEVGNDDIRKKANLYSTLCIPGNIEISIKGRWALPKVVEFIFGSAPFPPPWVCLANHTGIPLGHLDSNGLICRYLVHLENHPLGLGSVVNNYDECKSNSLCSKFQIPNCPNVGLLLTYKSWDDPSKGVLRDLMD